MSKLNIMKTSTIKTDGIIKETDKAIQFSFLRKKVWIPLSLIQSIDIEGRVTIPEWFYNKSSIANIVHYKAQETYSNYMRNLANA